MNTHHPYLEPELPSLLFIVVVVIVVVVVVVVIVVAVDERAAGLSLGAQQPRLALLHAQLLLPVSEPAPVEWKMRY